MAKSKAFRCKANVVFDQIEAVARDYKSAESLIMTLTSAISSVAWSRPRLRQDRQRSEALAGERVLAYELVMWAQVIADPVCGERDLDILKAVRRKSTVSYQDGHLVKAAKLVAYLALESAESPDDAPALFGNLAMNVAIELLEAAATAGDSWKPEHLLEQLRPTPAKRRVRALMAAAAGEVQ